MDNQDIKKESDQKKSVSFCQALCKCFKRGKKGQNELNSARNYDIESKKEELTDRQKIMQQNEEVENDLKERKQKYLEDFNEEGDDARGLTGLELKAMDRFKRFEKSFPFYRMDVNGFMELVRRAMRFTYYDEPLRQIFEIKHVTLGSLQNAFSKHETWAKQLVDDPENPTMLIKLLDNTCKYSEADAMSERSYSVKAIKVFAILWCNGKNEEKVVEFYDMLQDNNQKMIAATDKDFKENMQIMFDWATINILKFEWIIKPSMNPLQIDETDEELAQIKVDLEEKYEDLSETFIDQVFEYEAKLQRTEWEQIVIDKQEYVFYPVEIRKKLKKELESYQEVIKKVQNKAAP